MLNDLTVPFHLDPALGDNRAANLAHCRPYTEAADEYGNAEEPDDQKSPGRPVLAAFALAHVTPPAPLDLSTS